ncbi:cell cycle checkpoint [Trametes versicolor FP-101664 SS1]|uniref:cell cycle checkpoint n=1 Tax=Trametes versicolor (strain FP-101664) TaxID=717944 RepID=UPI0004622B6E|nr:cell cycle checkpoint [Trametes versicolor FP-101664 SS1]EIW63760.1 cell cycle checkpoint [Trametes versicolor FP-101664 SS1]
MRFRATIENVDTFAKIVQSVEKLQKKCTIKFAEHEMRIICAGDVNEGGIQVWSYIKVSSLFTEYRIQSNNNNEITISLSAEALLAALRSAAGPSTAQNSSNTVASESEVTMKLAKKGDKSVLSFDITGSTPMGRSITVVQHVTVEVVRHADVERLKEPMCPEPDVHILLPPLAKLRMVVDRLRPLSTDGVTFRANHSGELQLAATTDNARVEVGWGGLNNPGWSAQGGDADGSNAKDPAEMHGVLVSHRCLNKFLNSHVVSTTTIACICENHCVILYVYIGNVADAGGVLTYYIPAKFDDAM